MQDNNNNNTAHLIITITNNTKFSMSEHKYKQSILFPALTICNLWTIISCMHTCMWECHNLTKQPPPLFTVCIHFIHRIRFLFFKVTILCINASLQFTVLHFAVMRKWNATWLQAEYNVNNFMKICTKYIINDKNWECKPNLNTLSFYKHRNFQLTFL